LLLKLLNYHCWRTSTNGLENNLKIAKLCAEEVKEIEPHVRCIAGIRVFTTGIVNYKQVCQKYAELIRSQETVSILKLRKISETREAQVLETNKAL